MIWTDELPNFEPVKCECGADKLKQGIYGHSTWCPLYIAPSPISDNCNCGGVPGRQHWHSPLCDKRQWHEPEKTELELLQIKLKKIAEEL